MDIVSRIGWYIVAGTWGTMDTAGTLVVRSIAGSEYLVEFYERDWSVPPEVEI